MIKLAHQTSVQSQTIIIGQHECNVVLDTGAALIVTASDLVPAAAITETTIRMKGVNATEDVPLANVRMNIGNRHFWVTAVVVKEPPSDVLLGRDLS